jgi:GTPase SAR1 family protein
MYRHTVLPEDELSQAMYSQNVANPFVKVIVVGDGGAGKSETVQALKNGTFVGQHIITDLLDVATLQTDNNGAWSKLGNIGDVVGGALYEVQSRLCDTDLSTIERDIPKTAAGKLYSQHSAMMLEHMRKRDASRAQTSDAPAPQPSPTIIALPPSTNDDDDNDNYDNDKIDNGIDQNTSVANNHAANNIDDVNTSATTNNNNNDDNQTILKTWDFGGQPKFYVAHDLFLTDAVYVLVVNPLRDDCHEALERWLDVVLAHAENCRVLLVATHANHPLAQLSIAELNDTAERLMSLERRQLRVASIIKPPESQRLWLHAIENDDVNNKRRGIDTLQSNLLIAADAMRGPEVPVRWLALHLYIDELIGKGRHLLPLSDVKKVLQDATGASKRVDEAVAWLKSTGVILHFEKDEELKDVLFINPSWLIEMMKCFVSVGEYVQKQFNDAVKGDDEATTKRLNAELNTYLTGESYGVNGKSL